MSTLAIQVRGIGKHYDRATAAGGYQTLRESLSTWARGAFSRKPAAEQPGFWALKDINLDLHQGEVLGIIGRNGAGKSTFLKVLSRITEPTEGEIHLHGRVGSLLEVGTGFHPELTGRENIFLNGAILGMRRHEIAHRFDEIVAFSEVGAFLETPVKHYSSGMYVRLAFAVAAHLEPEILVVDEVLAVGDVGFQRKCLGKMGEVARGGRTVLFVSHNMAAIQSLTQRVVLLDGGRAVADGNSSDMIGKYLSLIGEVESTPLAQRTDRQGNGALRFTSFKLRDAQGNELARAVTGQDVALCLGYRVADGVAPRTVHVALAVNGQFDETLFHLSSYITGEDFDAVPQQGELRCLIRALPLLPGTYHFRVFSRVGGEIADWIQNAGALEVEAGDFFKTGKLPPRDQGQMLVAHSWSAADTTTPGRPE